MIKWLVSYEVNGRKHYERFEFLTVAELRRIELEIEGIDSVIQGI